MCKGQINTLIMHVFLYNMLHMSGGRIILVISGHFHTKVTCHTWQVASSKWHATQYFHTNVTCGACSDDIIGGWGWYSCSSQCEMLDTSVSEEECRMCASWYHALSCSAFEVYFIYLFFFYIIYLLWLVGIDGGLLMVGFRLLVAQVFRLYNDASNFSRFLWWWVQERLTATLPQSI